MQNVATPSILAGTCRMLCYLWHDWLIVIGYQSNMRYVLVWAGVVCNTFPDIFLSLYFLMIDIIMVDREVTLQKGLIMAEHILAHTHFKLLHLNGDSNCIIG